MSIDAAKLLLQDRYAPITSSMGFLGSDPETASQAFLAWRNEIGVPFHTSATARKVAGNLPSVLDALLPLQIGSPVRYLFLPTHGRWTAYFDSGYRGTDPSAIAYMAGRLTCRTLWIVATPHTLQQSGVPRRGRQGALVFEVYDPAEGGRSDLTRQIRLANDAGKWEFDQTGSPLPFEDTVQHKARTTSARFSLDALALYLESLGIHAFDDKFYMPAESPRPTIIEVSGMPKRWGSNVSLKRARRLNGIEDGLRLFGRLVSRRGYF